MKTTKVYEFIASKLSAIKNCETSGNAEWLQRHTDELESIVRNFAPSGSGIDNGTTINWDSKEDKLVFDTAYHHMNEGGCYDGWTEHQVIVTPSLQFGACVKITGRDRNDIKDYLHDTYSCWLFSSVEWVEESKSYRVVA